MQMNVFDELPSQKVIFSVVSIYPGITSGLCPSSGFLQTENTTFRKLDLFPSSGEGGGGTYSTEKQKACLSTGDTRTEEIRTMDKVQKLNSNEKYTVGVLRSSVSFKNEPVHMH
jgi:hypothetical protein